MSDIEVASSSKGKSGSAKVRDTSKPREKKERKDQETKTKAQLQREEREAKKASAEEAAAAKRLADKRAARQRQAEEREEAAGGSPADTRPKAQKDREEREAQSKAEAQANRAADRAAAKERKAKEASQPPKDTRSKAQKDRDARSDVKDLLKGAASSAVDFANSKTKPQNTAATKDGLAIFEELGDEEPAEVADWFLTQVRKAGKSDKGVENLPLYKFACAISSATDKQRQALAKTAISGYGMMEAEQRAQVLTLVVQSAGAAQKSTKNDTKFVANLRTVVKAARFDRIPEKEKESLMLATQAQAIQFATPQHIAEALHHMSEEERRQLSGALVTTKLIPADQAGLIEEIVQPDGILDEVHTAVNSAAVARDLVWVAAVLPVVEWLCAKRWLKVPDCSGGMVTWLHVDACLSLAMVLFVGVACKLLGPAYDVLAGDPAGALRRWQSSGAKGEDFGARLQSTARIDAVSYRFGSGAAVFSAALALFGGVYAVWGVWQLIDALTDGCIEMAVLFMGGVVALRSASVALVLYMAFRVFNLLQRHKFIGAEETPQPGYGSMEDAAEDNSKV